METATNIQVNQALNKVAIMYNPCSKILLIL